MHQKIKLKYSFSVKKENIQTSELIKNWKIRQQKKVRKKFKKAIFLGVCSKHGSISYSTFDGKAFKLSPERSYVMSRVPNQEGGFDLEIIATTQDCSINARKKVCIKKVEVWFGDHKLEVQAGENHVSILKNILFIFL